MTIDESELIKRIKRSLAEKKPHILGLKGRIPSAVIVPLLLKDDGLHILFTRRTEKVKDHKGQISFPGGARDERDRTLLDTALRETEEEIGISRDHIEILGRLDDISTYTGYRITPFVGLIQSSIEFRINEIEIKEIITCSVFSLMDLSIFSEELHIHKRRKYRVYYFKPNCNIIIWGATAGILVRFLETVFKWHPNLIK